MNENKVDLSLKELQTRITDMMVKLDAFLEEHQIHYFLWSGTMLGAVRHQGFIPWDDDMDIGLLRPDFEKLISIADKIPAPYKLKFRGLSDTDKNYPFLYAKFEDSSTILIEKNIKHLGVTSGLFIDIFAFDGVPDDEHEQKRHIRAFMRWMRIRQLLMMDADKKRNIIKQIPISIVGKVFTLDKVINKAEKLAKKYDVNTCRLLANYSGVYNKMSKIVEKENIVSDKKYQFEGNEFYGIANPDYVLTQFYGNYMQLPPEDKRVSTHEYDLYLNES